MESDSVRRSPALFPLYPELDTSSGNLQGIAAPEMFENPFPLDVRPPLNLFLRRAATSLTAQYIRAIRSLGSRTDPHTHSCTNTQWACVAMCADVPTDTTPHIHGSFPHVSQEVNSSYPPHILLGTRLLYRFPYLFLFVPSS